MSKYEVLVSALSEEHKAEIKLFAGSFDSFVDAKNCKGTYKKHFSPYVEIFVKGVNKNV